MQLNGTYYVGQKSNNSMPSSFGDFEMSDIACGVLLFAGWVGIFLRYGFCLQAIVYVALVTLLVVCNVLDRHLGRVYGLISLGIALLWLVSIWFLPYGTGPAHTAAGAGGLVPLLSGVFGQGSLPMALDGLLGCLEVFVLCMLLYIVAGVLTGENCFHPGVLRLVTATGLYFGTLGSLLYVAFALVAFLILSLGKRLFGGSRDDLFSSSAYYSSSAPAPSSTPALTTCIMIASIVIFVFL